jgi:DNA-binding transcriptional MerR regulator
MGVDRLLTIGAFARRARLSPKALRRYDRLGLLTPAHVDPGNGYRRYGESQLATARLVVMLRRLDMPLAQVAEVVAAENGRRAELVARYWADAERRMASQRELATHVQIRLSGGEVNLTTFDIKERDVAEQLVLTEQRHVRVPELSDWIGQATHRLIDVANQHGGFAGPMFVIYHGEVNEDSDGPVEVCLPIHTGVQTAIAAATRCEPAHREAYVRIRKAQVEFPQILTAYDAVSQWIGAHGRTIAAAPREVYFADFAAAGPNDEVCDIAFPIETA